MPIEIRSNNRSCRYSVCKLPKRQTATRRVRAVKGTGVHAIRPSAWDIYSMSVTGSSANLLERGDSKNIILAIAHPVLL